MDKDRDFVIERLEKQVIKKENEINTLKTSIKKEIIQEILSELLTDEPKKDRLLIIENRVEKYEKKIKELSNVISGLTNELLDQKAILDSFKKLNIKNEDTHVLSDVVNHLHKMQRYNMSHEKNYNIDVLEEPKEDPKTSTFIVANDDSDDKDDKINDNYIKCEDVEYRENEGVTIITRKNKDSEDI